MLARENVLVFNKDMVKEADLPASCSISPGPNGRASWRSRPTDADFLPLDRRHRCAQGPRGRARLAQGPRENAAIFDDDEGVVAAVDRGAAAAGIVNNYYWARLRMETGADKTKSGHPSLRRRRRRRPCQRLGRGRAQGLAQPAAAQKFLAYLVSKPAQEMVSRLDITFEYPLAAGRRRKPRAEAHVGTLRRPRSRSRTSATIAKRPRLLREAGLI